MRSRALNDLRLARLRLCKPVRENLPAVLLEAMAACPQIVEERDRFPELGSGRGQERFQFTDSMRERDLRRLEAIAKVAMCLLSHTDLVTLRSGRPRRDNSCDGIRVSVPRPREGRPAVGRATYSTIETETGLGRSALFAALRDGRDAGYWSSSQEVKRWYDDDGVEHFRGMPAVYVISKLLFQRLGIDLEWLEAERSKASQRRTQEPAPIVDIRERRMRQRVIHQQQAIAAKTARFQRQFEATAAERLERIRRRTTEEKKQE